MIQMKNLSKFVIFSGKSRSSRKIGENSQWRGAAGALITTTMTADQRVRTLEIVISYIVKITFNADDEKGPHWRPARYTYIYSRGVLYSL